MSRIRCVNCGESAAYRCDVCERPACRACLVIGCELGEYCGGECHQRVHEPAAPLTEAEEAAAGQRMIEEAERALGVKFPRIAPDAPCSACGKAGARCVDLAAPLWLCDACGAVPDDPSELRAHLECVHAKLRTPAPALSPSRVDAIVCAWSMTFGIALTEVSLNALVEAISSESRAPLRRDAR